MNFYCFFWNFDFFFFGSHILSFSGTTKRQCSFVKSNRNGAFAPAFHFKAKHQHETSQQSTMYRWWPQTYFVIFRFAYRIQFINFPIGFFKSNENFIVADCFGRAIRTRCRIWLLQNPFRENIVHYIWYVWYLPFERIQALVHIDIKPWHFGWFVIRLHRNWSIFYFNWEFAIFWQLQITITYGLLSNAIYCQRVFQLFLFHRQYFSHIHTVITWKQYYFSIFVRLIAKYSE